MTIERPEAFNFFGPQTLIGPELKPGDQAPDFTVYKAKFVPVTLAELLGKPLLLSSVPSLDTGVCSRQTIRFNQEATALGDAVTIATISADLPFAQARWCGANEVSNLATYSDSLAMSFGQAFGTMVHPFRINSRAVFVVDGQGRIRHAEYVPTAGQEPDYDAALAVLKSLLPAE